jgi:hypothetical protein
LQYGLLDDTSAPRSDSTLIAGLAAERGMDDVSTERCSDNGRCGVALFSDGQTGARKNAEISTQNGMLRDLQPALIFL